VLLLLLRRRRQHDLAWHKRWRIYCELETPAASTAAAAAAAVVWLCSSTVYPVCIATWPCRCCWLIANNASAGCTRAV
jgi:hypothetical protein